jgi:hypothetical protein
MNLRLFARFMLAASGVLLLIAAFDGGMIIPVPAISGCLAMILAGADWLAQRFARPVRRPWLPAVVMLTIAVGLPLLSALTQPNAESGDTLYDQPKNTAPRKTKPFRQGQVCALNIVELENVSGAEWRLHHPDYLDGERGTPTIDLGTDLFSTIGYFQPADPNGPPRFDAVWMPVLSPAEGISNKYYPICFTREIRPDSLHTGGVYRMTGKLVVNPACDITDYKARRWPPAMLLVNRIEPVEIPVNRVIENWSSFPPFHPVEILPPR